MREFNFKCLAFKTGKRINLDIHLIESRSLPYIEISHLFERSEEEKDA